MKGKSNESKKKDTYILDCTFRDGGYYTNWIFENEIINEYLEICNQGLCEIVELGLRTPKSGEYLGPHAYTCPEYFKYCRNFKNLKYSVLVNWKDISLVENPENLFLNNSENDVIDIVRIAIKHQD